MPSRPPCQLSEIMLFHNSLLCVTHHGNKCVHSFEDCHHDRAHLSNFPSRIVMPSNHSLPPTAPAKEKSLEDVTINSIIVLGVAFAASILNVTPERRLQPPGPLLVQRGCRASVLMLGDWDVAVSQNARGGFFLTLDTDRLFFLDLCPSVHQCDQGYSFL